MLAFTKNERNMCLVKDTNDMKKPEKVISCVGNDNPDEYKLFKEYQCVGDEKLQQLPNNKSEREIIFCCGASGSGKSTYIYNYCMEWKKRHKGKDIYVFSALTDDSSIDKLKPKRIKIDDELIQNPLSASDFENSMIIFDDIDVIQNKEHKKAVQKILMEVLQIGRHFKISCCMSNHLLAGGSETKHILNECHSITYYPRGTAPRSIKYLTENYIGLTKEQRLDAEKSNSRWITCFKQYPLTLMTERMIKVL